MLSQLEWSKRSEEFGNDAAATILIDGSVLYRGFNHGEPMREVSELIGLLKLFGYFYEMSTTWAVHVYPNEV